MTNTPLPQFPGMEPQPPQNGSVGYGGVPVTSQSSQPFNPLPTPRYDPAHTAESQNPQQTPYTPPQQQPVQQAHSYQPATQATIDPFNPPAPQPTQDQYSIDYLNRIAPQETRSVNKFAIIGLILGVLTLATVALVILSGFANPNVNDQVVSLQGRVSTLKTVTDAEDKKLKETNIVATNATLGSALTTMSTDLSSAVPKKTKPSKEEVAYQATLQDTLDDAYQRGTLDRTYASQMAYELNVLRSKFTRLKASSNKESVDDFCDTSVSNIDIALKSLAQFDATK